MSKTIYKLKFEFEPERQFAGAALNRIFMSHEFTVMGEEFAKMLGEAGMEPGIEVRIRTTEAKRHSTVIGRD